MSGVLILVLGVTACLFILAILPKSSPARRARIAQQRADTAQSQANAAQRRADTAQSRANTALTRANRTQRQARIAEQRRSTQGGRTVERGSK